ncbi:c-type cytochrome biogenesis protein CcmI [Pseudooctadecabacter jejudonensis]|uniref:Cytochrome c-type biogenesis protein CcmH n=1 Tax=Pseudooctadecabacter jejudonensis TaxID=1391910 RepID=A0A1Y5RJ33_9RHOB|nr:c-type cytochrome biogenesis protein CcmI [Pseudooctadecabacter jejudonensis]SLN17346.1 hypothetical protein PSJ8397_00550 [Pseudooctadecabacter jejudonensis]
MTGFILIAALLAGLSALAIAAPLWRTRGRVDNTDTDIDIYRDQLAEVDRDLDRGTLDPTEAERTRTEISRRLLAADAASRTAAIDAPKAVNRGAAVVMGVALLAAAGWLYATLGAPGYGDVPRELRLAVGEERRANRPGQLEAEAATQIPDVLDQFDEATQDLIRTRRAATFERPEDLTAWTVLAQTEAAIGQYHRATRAQERIIALKGSTVETEDYERLLDIMIAGTQGYVSPEAEAVALRVLQDAPDSQTALYYAGLMYAQNDRPDRAFDLWRRVIENGPVGTLHYEFATGQIGEVAAQLGVDYALPETRGPSAQDLDAAQDMSPEDRRAMIEGMVGGLADRLATEGGPPQDWARLITSLMIIEQTEAAARVLAEAELIFGGDVQAVTLIRRAAAEAGLTE